VADAAKSAKDKFNAKIDADAERLLAQGDAIWADQGAAVAAGRGVVQERIDAALAAVSAGIAGGQGVEMLLQVVRSGGECGFEVMMRAAAEVVTAGPNLGVAEVVMVRNSCSFFL
jgi:hypothetical protein